MNADNEVHSFRLAAGAGPLFAAIKNDERARNTEMALAAEALLATAPTTRGGRTIKVRRIRVATAPVMAKRSR